MKKHILFIIGMGRSGTSALARVLSLCGCTLPSSLVRAGEGNPKGFFEPVDALFLNDEFLFQHGVTWFDPTMRLCGEITFDRNEKENYVRRIQEFLKDCPPAPALVIKEPRITALLEFWIEAACREAFSVEFVIPVRHPGEVAASMAGAGASVELSHALWLKYNLLAERNSRGLPRVFVQYSNLLSDWRMEVARISEKLSINLDARDETAIDAFLTRDLHRQRNPGPVVEIFGSSWVPKVYTILSTASQDEPIDDSALDEIYYAYRTSERAFRVSWDNYLSNFTPHLLLRKVIEHGASVRDL